MTLSCKDRMIKELGANNKAMRTYRLKLGIGELDSPTLFSPKSLFSSRWNKKLLSQEQGPEPLRSLFIRNRTKSF